MLKAMNSYEYPVSSGNADAHGCATVPSIFGCMLNAMEKDIAKDGSRPVLLRSELEIDERPKVDDAFNVLVINDTNEVDYRSNINVNTQNKYVVLTDSEGIEIGRGMTEWYFDERAQNRAHEGIQSVETVGLVEKFCALLPKGLISGGLQTRIDIDFAHSVHAGDEMTFGITKAYDDRYLFVARSGDRTLCRASLQVA